MPGKNTQAQPNVLLREANLRREREKTGTGTGRRERRYCVNFWKELLRPIEQK